MLKFICGLIIGCLLMGAAYAQNLFTLPNWTSSTRYGSAPGAMGYNTTTTAPEWFNGTAWNTVPPLASPAFTGTVTSTSVINAPTVSGNLVTGGAVTANSFGPVTIYSAAGTPVPTCNSGINGFTIVASDITTATYRAAYVSGGTNLGRLFCVNGTGWLAD